MTSRLASSSVALNFGHQAHFQVPRTHNFRPAVELPRFRIQIHLGAHRFFTIYWQLLRLLKMPKPIRLVAVALPHFALSLVFLLKFFKSSSPRSCITRTLNFLPLHRRERFRRHEGLGGTSTTFLSFFSTAAAIITFCRSLLLKLFSGTNSRPPFEF